MNDEGVTRETIIEEEREQNFKKTVGILAVILTVAIVGLIYSLKYAPSTANSIYAVLFGVVGCTFVVLDYLNRFHRFQHEFEIGRRQTAFLLCFCSLAFIDYILIGLEDDGIVKGRTMFWIIEVLYYISLALFFCTFMAYWKPFAFHASENSWIHAFFYLSLIGYFLVAVARWLRPPPEDEISSSTHWHRKHSTTVLLESVTGLLILLFVFCVVLG